MARSRRPVARRRRAPLAAERTQTFVALAANSGTVLIREGGGPFRVYTHSSGVDFAGVTALPDGTFLLVGEDGIFSYPEQAGEEQSDD